jgi:hypothetical protein
MWENVSSRKYWREQLYGNDLLQSNAFDLTGRAIAASPWGKGLWTGFDRARHVVGENPPMERGRMLIGSSFFLGKAIGESLDIATLGYSRLRKDELFLSTSAMHRAVWSDAFKAMIPLATTNMASEQADMFLPRGKLGEHLLGPFQRAAAKWATEFALTTISKQGINWYAHNFVDSKVKPFENGVLRTLGQTATTLGVGYALTNRVLVDGFTKITGLPSQLYRAGAWAIGRTEGSRISRLDTAPIRSASEAIKGFNFRETYEDYWRKMDHEIKQLYGQ